MPRNQFQRMIFALLTVIITVHGYVFYSLYVVNGKLLMEITGADSVLGAIKTQGGVYMFGRMLPICCLLYTSKELNCTAVYIGPLFESSTHGYDTMDYKKVDRRLGDNDDFRQFVAACHEQGIKVVVDGVFNHTAVSYTHLYTFLIHICLKEEYRVREVRKNPDTFFEEIMNAFLDKSGNRLYEDLAFAVRKDSGVSLQILGLFEVTNLIFERRDMDGQP